MLTKVERAQKLLDQTLRVFYHPSFDDPEQISAIVAPMPENDKFEASGAKVRRLRINRKIAPEMQPCYEAALLNSIQEKHLFRQMNYYKYKAKKVLGCLNLRRPNEKKLLVIERYLDKSKEIRNKIAESNFRLATQILRGNITFYREHSLTEALLSDGYFDVLKAVDYFNWTLGNQFSTYATWVVRKNFYRDSKQKITHSERFTYLSDARAETIQSRGEGYEQEKNYSDQTQLIKQLLNQLLTEGDDSTDRSRQVLVLESYFGVNGRSKHTLEEISAEIGVTKERVRQLKERGLEWIRDKVEEMGIDCESLSG